MKKKRLLSLALAVTMLFGSAAALPDIVYDEISTATVSAEGETSGQCGDDVFWTLEDGVLTISGTGYMYNYTYDQRSPFDNRNDITSVIIKQGIISIGDGLFTNCKNLESVTIPSSVTVISSYPFDGTKWLSDQQKKNPLVIVNGILIDGTKCTGKVTIPQGVTQISVSAFCHSNSLTSVTIPNSVTSIGISAFEGCENLTNVTISKGVISIGDSAFNSCKSLESIIIPDSVTNLGSIAFLYCKNLANITVPSSISSIGGHAFEETKWLENQRKKNPLVVVNGILIDGQKCNGKVIIPDNVTSICDYAFGVCEGLTSVVFSDNVTSIGDYAFCGCYYLTSVTIPSSVSSIGKSAFENCDNLTSVSISSGVTRIEARLFKNCSKLTSIDLPESVIIIDEFAFRECTSLNNITIPNSVTIISDYAFLECKSLERICIPNSVSTIGKYAFDSCNSLTEVTIMYGVSAIGLGAFQQCNKLKTVTIPKSVKSIDNMAFLGCTNLTSVTIPDSVTSIGRKAFGYFKDESYLTQKVDNFKIYCYKGTAGEKYAKDNGFAYELLPVYSTESGATEISLQQGATTDITLTIHRDKNDDQTYALFEGVEVDGTLVDPKNYTAAKGSLKLTLKASYLSTLSVGEHSMKVLFKDGEYVTKLNVKKNAEPIRLKGSGRFATAAAISTAAYPKTADTVVLANGRKFYDALAGVTLANAYNAPILLTEANALPAETLAEIKRLKAKKVIILGGSGSVGAEVKQALTDNGLEYEIVKGSSRFATAVEIAKKTKEMTKKDPTEIFFVSSDKFADALSVSAVAALKKAPIIYLPKTGAIDAVTSAYLKNMKGKIKNAYVIGGSGVIGADVMAAAAKALGLTVDKTIVRVKGKTKYDTCVAVNTKFASVLTGKAICVATGEDFPDALAGGVFAAQKSAPLFLASGTLSNTQKSYLQTKNADSIFVFGGSKSVPDTLVQNIAAESV